jgi:purine-binding chemotaxis protein CheW
MLILRIDDHVFGVIVDNIDKVVGISSTQIQAPHPIFGDINIKYIRGVVENQDRLYIILDIVRIFSPKKEEKVLPPVAAVTASFAEPLPVAPVALNENTVVSTSDLDFIKETLYANKRFATSEMNDAWVATRFKEWKGMRKSADVQLRDQADAEAYLEGFYSPCSGQFWDDTYADAMLAMLPEIASRNINVWNPGCGKGLETYSFACVLRRRYQNARVKIWANDSDLLSISSAPNLVFDMEELPDYCREFTIKGKNGYSFSQDLKDSIMFEYHDVLNANPFPELDIVLARDLLSFLSPADQVRVFNDFSDKLKSRGILILGKNERPVPIDDWASLGSPDISAWSRAD